ncbi:MAG: hypothetical protein DME26_01550 [Verrucomicrobia bacterium]|nr:MAG: hypothetical protein DME26_01550 [Verrucomicrobiota bacterium]
MSQPYEEIFDGALTPRKTPGARHELICLRLHAVVKAGVADVLSTRLLAPRTQVRVAAATTLCPDLALVTAATNKLWLAAEIVSPDDHRPDTVVNRLWMIDPRYDNVEVYHASAYGLMLKGILAGREVLTENLLPEFALTISELFAAQNPA